MLSRVACPCHQLLQAVGVAGTPRWLVWMRNNKVAVFFLAFAASQGAARLTSTGAFEVFYDGAARVATCCLRPGLPG